MNLKRMQSNITYFAMLLIVPLQSQAQGELPVVHDPRLKLTLVAESPEVATPIGLAIDCWDRLFVLESHTHERPARYQGPKSDRVKMFTDGDGDGKFESVSIFAEGIQTGLNLAFSPDGVLYVVCAREVLQLPDVDRDGACDGVKRVLEMETNEGYSHNCLLGITFDRDGWMYLARGNTGSRAYEFNGGDGSRVGGYGDGGSILRCRPDGSQITEFATGFWNPFEIKFDHAGRLLCVDNDPDARGPNRLLHVVEGGDYGYKSLYGGGGNHPFQGWDGLLPGTLPYISGTGEAPCNLLDCRLASLPLDYSDSVLVTVWNENSIERHCTQPRGASLQAESRVLVFGGDNFRPVAMEADSRGNVYFTDWVLVAYPNHGRGRLWRLSTDDDSETFKPRSYFDPPDDSQPVNSSNLASSDPFERHAAVMKLARESSVERLHELTSDASAEVRLTGLLAAQRSNLGEENSQRLARRLLADPNEVVRRAALVWVGTSFMTSLRSDIDRAIAGHEVSAVLFETYLATAQNLDPDFARAVRGREQDRSKDIHASVDEDFLAGIAVDKSRSATVRSLAVMRLVEPRKQRGFLLDLAGGGELQLQLAAIRRLSGDASESVRRQFLTLALDAQQDEIVRCEALLSISKDIEFDARTILHLLDADSPAIAVEAARTLRQLPRHDTVIAAAQKKRESLQANSSSLALEEQLAFVLGEPAHDRPGTSDDPEAVLQWQATLSSGGDPNAGRRVFYSTHAMCSKCHTTGGVGGTLGPDLSNIAQSVDRKQIIHSILRPSDQFPPQYQAWVVLTVDGQTHIGLQLDHKAGGAIELYTTDGTSRHFAPDEIEGYRASKQSIMPTGLEANLSVSEFRDLIAYLAWLK